MAKGSYVAWADLSARQQQEVLAMYPLALRTGGFRHEYWSYYIMPDGHLTKAKGRHQASAYGKKMMEEEHRRILAGPPPRVEKGDLAAWKPGVEFHFSRD